MKIHLSLSRERYESMTCRRHKRRGQELVLGEMTTKKEQITAYIEEYPEYKMREVCSRIFWKDDEDSKRSAFIANMINLIIGTRDNIIIKCCPVNGETPDKTKEIVTFSWIGDAVKR